MHENVAKGVFVFAVVNFLSADSVVLCGSFEPVRLLHFVAAY